MNTERKLALVSVTDKTGIVEFASGLTKNGYEILSTGGTAKLLKESGVSVIEVAAFADSPEILGGRVKTLHPKIHGGILMDRQNPTHLQEAKDHGIEPIDMVVVNLYQFSENAVADNLEVSKAIEFIDIGGPTMLRAAAKNHQFVLPVIDPTDYSAVLHELESGDILPSTRVKLANKTFANISNYDATIAGFLGGETPETMTLSLTSQQKLRYGENPHQNAQFYTSASFESGFQDAKVLQGKELSYNNYIDIDAAAAIVADFPEQKAVAIIKHTNPCGVAVGNDDSLESIYRKALEGDPKSAFGGIVAFNQEVDSDTAKAMAEIFLECIVAPSFSDEAKDVFSKKKNLRILEAPFLAKKDSPTVTPRLRSIRGGVLAQSADDVQTAEGKWESVTKRAPTAQEAADLSFAMRVAKHVKSNAIVYAKNGQTITVGAGQMSRIDAATFAAQKAKEDGKTLEGAVLASDAFFPFSDTVELAAKFGIAAIVQPGGSKRDNESIEAADQNQMAMVFTGIRHFKH